MATKVSEHVSPFVAGYNKKIIIDTTRDPDLFLVKN